MIETKDLTSELDRKGVKEGDFIHFEPLYGRKRSFQIQRTQIDFLTSSLNDSSAPGTYRHLDSLENEKFHYRLKLITTKGNGGKHSQRYFFESLNKVPFKQNGVICLSAFVEINDSIEMGYNVISFKKRSPCSLSCEAIDFSKDQKIIESNLPILLVGETGTGKTRLAKLIHEKSRGSRPFIHLNLASLSPNLIESELFGHIKGAFTGAITDKLGALCEAAKGTLFLDEIDSLPIETQTKLLIFLDEFKIKAVGSNFERKINCRLICASGRDLKQLVSQGKMRSDFYYRINSGLSLKLNPLRDDKNLIERLLNIWSVEHSISLSPKLVEFYKTLPWVGNIRELQSHIKKKIVTTNGNKIVFDRYDEELIAESSSLEFLKNKEETYVTLEELVMNYTKNIYYKMGQNATLTAKKLNISSRSVKRYLDKVS